MDGSYGMHHGLAITLQGMATSHHPLDSVFAGEVFVQAQQKLSSTYRRIELIDDVVNITPGVFGQYQTIRLSKLADLIATKKPFTKPVNKNLTDTLGSEELMTGDIDI